MNGSEVELINIYRLQRYSFGSSNYSQFDRNECYEVRRFLTYVSSFLKPEHFGNIIKPDKASYWYNPTLYVTKFGAVINDRHVGTDTKISLKLKRTRNAVNCALEYVTSTNGVPLFTDDNGNSGKSFSSIKAGRPNLQRIILNGEEYTNDWKSWPEEIKSFQL